MQQQIESMQGKVDYELVSICNHYGEIDSGHYIGVCKRGSEWIIFDDEQYSQTENLHVIATKADFMWICNVLPQMLGQLGVCFPELALDALERTIEFHKAMNNALFFLFGEHLCSKISTAVFEALFVEVGKVLNFKLLSLFNEELFELEFFRMGQVIEVHQKRKKFDTV
jgi:hypothetical protein